MTDWNKALEEAKNEGTFGSAGRNLSTSLKQSIGASPQDAANVSRLSKESGLPFETVERNRAEVEKANKYKQLNIKDIIERSPNTAEFLSDPYKARQTHDDIENMALLEQAISSGARGVDLMQGMNYGFMEAVGEAIGSENLTRWAKEGRERNEAEAAVNGSRPLFTDIDSASDFGEWLLNTASEQIPMMAPSLAGAGGGAAIGTAIAPGIGTAIGAGIGAFIPSFVMGTGETQMAIKEKDETVEAPGIALGAGSIVGALDSALPGKVGTRIASAFGVNPADAVADIVVRETLTEAAKRIALDTTKGATLEGVTEAIQEAVVEVAASHATDQEIDSNEIITAMVEGFAAGFFMGGTISGISDTAATTIRNKQFRQYQSLQDEQKVAAILKGIDKSNLTDDRQDVLKEFISKLGENTDSSKVYIDPDEANKLFQNTDLTDELIESDVFKQISEAIPAAMESGSRVELPVDMLVDMQAAGIADQLQPYMTLDPDALTPAEMQSDSIKEEYESLVGMDGEQRSAEADVYNDVLGQLIGMGQERGTAEQYAMLWEAFFRTQAKRTGRNASELYDQYGFRAENEIDPAIKERAAKIDQIDVMLDRLRSGDIPKENEIFGKTAMEYIIEKGGILDDGGELAAMDADAGRVGRNRITREGGRSIDDAAEYLMEAGYIQERSEQAVIDIIDSELRGEPVYSIGTENQELMGVRDSLNELDEILSRAGLDLNIFSNKEIREALGEQSGETLTQPKLSETQDFGDIELSDEIQVEGTDQTVTVRRSAQRSFDQLMKRRNVVEQIKGCLNG